MMALSSTRQNKDQPMPQQAMGETTTKIVSEYDQEIQQSETADNPYMAQRGRATRPSRDTRKTN